MKLALVFTLEEIDTPYGESDPLFPMQQIVIELDADQVAALRRVKGMTDALDGAMGVTQSQLDEAKVEMLDLKRLVQPPFEAAGAAAWRFAFMKAAEAYAEPEAVDG